MVPRSHTVVVCVIKRWRGGGLVNMEPLKLYSSRALFGIDPHSGSVYPHSGCLCYEGMEGEPLISVGLSLLFYVKRGGRGRGPGEHGALKVVFQ